MLFKDRTDAGKKLAKKLLHYRDDPDAIVLALPRGGVPVAFEVAQELHVPMDVFLVRKMGVPGQEELALGAIAMGGIRVLNPMLVQLLNLSEDELDMIAEEEQVELDRRLQAYRDDRPMPEMYNRTVILIDDGLATGATMRAAVLALRQQDPARIVVGVPVSSPETCDDFKDNVDEIICAATPEPFRAVGLWYEDFDQVTDDEVRGILSMENESVSTV